MAPMAPLLIDTSAFVWTVGAGGTARDFGHSSRLIYNVYEMCNKRYLTKNFGKGY